MAFFSKTAHKSKSQKNGFAKVDPAGVGIVFKSGPDEALFVKALADGAPAANCGMIRVNDCLTKVDGEDVYRMPIEKVVKYILGEKGSEIRLTFQRFSGDKLSKFTVKLYRGNPASIKAAVPWADEDEDEDDEEALEEEHEEKEVEVKETDASVGKQLTLEEKQRISRSA
uniref:PDZ domain-containing protein n=1 Tax=Hemiselmis andersenii TaxID=464988 RepID=A0A7S0XSL5_HEMAN|mmetsp:Transcript_17743/g.40894  ORF Transcript_17743/g.40894 Transcript_17743/m.40894 type:complete len:170 (+) Transcript_17743:96-605(+)